MNSVCREQPRAGLKGLGSSFDGDDGGDEEASSCWTPNPPPASAFHVSSGISVAL